MAQHSRCYSFSFLCIRLRTQRSKRSFGHTISWVSALEFIWWSFFYHGRQGGSRFYFFLLEYFERLRTNRVMISSLECFRIGAKGYHIYFYSPLLCEGPDINSPGSREPEMTARDHGAACSEACIESACMHCPHHCEWKSKSLQSIDYPNFFFVQHASHPASRDLLLPQQLSSPDPSGVLLRASGANFFSSQRRDWRLWFSFLPSPR